MSDGNGHYRARWNPEDGGNGGLRRGWWVEERDSLRVPYSGLRNRERAEYIADRLNDDPLLPEEFVMLDQRHDAVPVRRQLAASQKVNVRDEVGRRLRERSGRY